MFFLLFKKTSITINYYIVIQYQHESQVKSSINISTYDQTYCRIDIYVHIILLCLYLENICFENELK